MNLKWCSPGKCFQTLAGSFWAAFGVGPSRETNYSCWARQSSPLKCFSRASCRLAWVLERSWLTASCFFISLVIPLPRLSSSTEWYLRHKLLRFSWVELMLLCWLWSSFCISCRIKGCREGYSSHSGGILRLLPYGTFLETDTVGIHPVMHTCLWVFFFLFACDLSVLILSQFCPALLGNNCKQLLRGS